MAVFRINTQRGIAVLSLLRPEFFYRGRGNSPQNFVVTVCRSHVMWHGVISSFGHVSGLLTWCLLSEIFMNRMLARKVKLLAFEKSYRHTRCTGAIAACCEVVCITLTERVKEKEDSRRENVIIYCMLCGLCKFIFGNAGRSQSKNSWKVRCL